MKKNLSLAVIAASLVLLGSCKKEEIKSTEISGNQTTLFNGSKNPNILSTTEPVGGPPIALQLQPDGTYKAFYSGVTLTFSNITKRVPPYQDGEPVGTVSVSSDYSSGVAVSQDEGPYFSGYQLVYGMPAGYVSGLNAYRIAYSNYIFDKKGDNGQLLQSNIPLINDFVPSIDNQLRPITGKVVMWSSAASGLAVVKYDYVGPKQMVYIE